MPRILITRAMPDRVLERARTLGEVIVEDTPEGVSPDAAREALAAYDIIVPTLGDRFTAEAFAGGDDPRCKLLANFGMGYNHIDIAAARDAGIAVTNTPGAVTDATADVALMLMLMACRRASEGEAMVRAGRGAGVWTTGAGRTPAGAAEAGGGAAGVGVGVAAGEGVGVGAGAVSGAAGGAVARGPSPPSRSPMGSADWARAGPAAARARRAAITGRGVRLGRTGVWAGRRGGAVHPMGRGSLVFWRPVRSRRWRRPRRAGAAPVPGAAARPCAPPHEGRP